MSRQESAPVLVIHDRPGSYILDLRERFPALVIETVEAPAEVAAAVRRLRPEVVFSCKSPGMPGSAHRAAVESSDVKWLHVAGAGFDHLQPIVRDDLTITNSAGVLARFMGETVLGAMLMLNFGFHRYVAYQRERRWLPEPWTSLEGRTALIVGLGSIGRVVAGHCRHLGMRVLGLRRSAGPVPDVDETITMAELADALSRSDVLCVHVPLTAESRGMIGAREFAAMKRGTIVVNTARGGVMDESALVRALVDGRVAAAHLDVFAREPLPADSPLWDAPNLVITPHVADSVSDYESRFARFFADNLALWLEGKPLMNVVDLAAGY